MSKTTVKFINYNDHIVSLKDIREIKILKADIENSSRKTDIISIERNDNSQSALILKPDDDAESLFDQIWAVLQ